MFGFNLGTEDMEELEDEIRATCKITIRTLEIFYEELQNSSLPDEVKLALLTSKANSK
jgi:hypothetical protein